MIGEFECRLSCCELGFVSALIRSAERPLGQRLSGERHGEQSTDEMGSVSLQVVAASQGELPDLQQAIARHVQDKAQDMPLLGGLLRGLGARR